MSGETGRSISNADKKMVQALIGASKGNVGKKVKRNKMVQALIGASKGGVRNKAKRNTKTTPFRYGGAVSRGCGAAVSGKKFSGVR